MTVRRTAVLLGFAITLAMSSPSLAQRRPVAPPAVSAETDVTPPPKTALEPPRPSYSRKGRRDPFHPIEIPVVPVIPEVKLVVATARLKGILRGGATRALLETPDGIGYIMKPGDTLAEGRLIEIGTDSVVFYVSPRPGLTTNRVLLRLPTD